MWQLVLELLILSDVLTVRDGSGRVKAMLEEIKWPGIHCSRMRHYFQFTLSFCMDHIQTEYNLRTRTSQEVAAKLSCRIRCSEGRPKYSTALFSDVGLCEDWCYFSSLSCLLTAATVHLLFLCRRSQDSQMETQGTYMGSRFLSTS